MISWPEVNRRQHSFEEIKQGFTTQMRVFKALIMRETMTRYGEHKLGFFWAILEPMAMVAVFVGIFAVIRNNSPSGMPVVVFLLTGMAPFSAFRDTMMLLQNSLAANKMLLTFPQVTTFDVIMARAVLETVMALGVFALLLVITYFLGFEFRIENPLGVLAACLLLATMGVAAGITFASLRPLFPSIQQLTGALLNRPLYLGSGIFFTAEMIPEPARTWILYNPLLHAVELLRSEFFYQFESEYGSWSYATTWALCFLTFSLLLHQALRKRALLAL